MVSGPDKRRTPRLAIGFKVKVDTKMGTFNGVGRDLSEGGIGVYLRKLPPIGSPVEVRFQLPDRDHVIEVTGEVMYHRRGEPGVHDDWMGVRFLRMDAASQAVLHSYLKANYDGSKPYLTSPPPLPKR